MGSSIVVVIPVAVDLRDVTDSLGGDVKNGDLKSRRGFVIACADRRLNQLEEENAIAADRVVG